MADYFRKCDGQKLEIRLREMLGWLLSYQIPLPRQRNGTIDFIWPPLLCFVFRFTNKIKERIAILCAVERKELLLISAIPPEPRES